MWEITNAVNASECIGILDMGNPKRPASLGNLKWWASCDFRMETRPGILIQIFRKADRSTCQVSIEWICSNSVRFSINFIHMLISTQNLNIAIIFHSFRALSVDCMMACTWDSLHTLDYIFSFKCLNRLNKLFRCSEKCTDEFNSVLFSSPSPQISALCQSRDEICCFS